MNWPTWADLRTIGNSSAVKAAIVVPIIGYLIVLNSTLVEYAKMHGIEPSVPATGLWDRLWGLKLYFIYFGLMVLGIGSIFYQWKCPQFVKKHADWTDYVAGTAPHMDPSGIESLRQALGYFNVLHEHPHMTLDEICRLYLRRHYADMSHSHLPWRIVTTVCFGGGFALLSIPSAMTAARVLRALLANSIF